MSDRLSSKHIKKVRANDLDTIEYMWIEIFIDVPVHARKTLVAEYFPHGKPDEMAAGEVREYGSSDACVRFLQPSIIEQVDTTTYKKFVGIIGRLVYYD